MRFRPTQWERIPAQSLQLLEEGITLLGDGLVVKHLGETEVDEFKVEVRIKHDIFELDIAMNDATSMKVMDREDLNFMRGGNERGQE